MNITFEQAKQRFQHSLDVKKQMIEAADERLQRWQKELTTTGQVTFC